MSEQNVEEGSISSTASPDEQASGVITIVLTADNHLGYAAAGQGSRKREERKQRLRHAFQQATDFAIGQGVDLFIQAGDLFDSTSPDEQDRSFVATRLAQLRQAGTHAFALGGLHDTPSGNQASSAPQISYARLGAWHYFPPQPTSFAEDRGKQEGEPQALAPVVLEIHGTRVGICGLGVVAGQDGDPLDGLQVESEIERAAIPLLLLHAPIEGFTADVSPPEIRALVQRASIERQSAFRYILAGYHHGYRRALVGATEVVVAGATQHVDFQDPTDDPGFVFLGLAADGVRWCKHIAVDALHFHRLVVRTTELWPTDEEAVPVSATELVLERLRPVCGVDVLLHLRFEGELTRRQYHQLDLNAIRRIGEEQCFALSLDESAFSFLPEPQAVSAETGERFSPREELVALADEWIAGAEDEQERKALLVTKEELLAALDGVRYPASRGGLLH
ncbi:MAG TPA: metallophosphoesterase [Ktedonobacteraceae bacterium]|jgi:DNA repair exonuclease SbcCD nuclease subunit